jgi:hypothetical protein
MREMSVTEQSYSDLAASPDSINAGAVSAMPS